MATYNFGEVFTQAYLNRKKREQEDRQFQQDMAFRQRQLSLLEGYKQKMFEEEEKQTRFQEERIRLAESKEESPYGFIGIGRSVLRYDKKAGESKVVFTSPDKPEEEPTGLSGLFGRVGRGISEVKTFKKSLEYEEKKGEEGKPSEWVWKDPSDPGKKTIVLRSQKEYLKSQYKDDAIALVNKLKLENVVDQVRIGLDEGKKTKGSITPSMLEYAIEQYMKTNPLSSVKKRALRDYFTLMLL